jgi:hemin uptake protein HemP
MQANQRDQNSRPTARDSAGSGQAAAPTVRVIDSETLLGPRREVQIRHKGAVYTLRETRQGKLILNK